MALARINRERSVSLAEDLPELAKEWSANNILGSEEVASHSMKKALWICPKEGHEWECAIHNRAKGDQCHFDRMAIHNK